MRLVLLAVGLLLPATALAQPAPDGMETTRGLALGTGARASATSTSALAYHPAGLGIGRLYHVELAGAYEPAFGRFSVMSSVVDSMTNRVAAGLSLRGLFGGDSSDHSGIDGRLALALPLGEAISLGVAGRYVSFAREGQPAPGVEPSPLPEGFTMDASLRLSPLPGLHLAAFGYNLLDLESPYAPMMAGGSAAYTFGDALTVGADVLVDFTTFERTRIVTGGGVEYLSGGRIPLRVGYVYDQGRRLHSVTGGVGYVEQKVGIDVSVRQQVSGGDDTTVMASLRYFVQ